VTYGNSEICERAQKAQLRCPAEAELDFSDTVTDHRAPCQGCNGDWSPVSSLDRCGYQIASTSEVIWRLLLSGKDGM
jgi:hypothetical protein